VPRSLAALVEAGRRPGEKKLRVGLDGAAVVGAGGQVLHGAGSVLVCVNDVNSGLASDASVAVPFGAASVAAGGGLVQRRGGRRGCRRVVTDEEKTGGVRHGRGLYACWLALSSPLLQRERHRVFGKCETFCQKIVNWQGLLSDMTPGLLYSCFVRSIYEGAVVTMKWFT